jgi:RAQPRD family integrative conjugative element protein
MHSHIHKYMNARWLAVILVIGLVFRLSPAMADPDAEREALARLIHEIEALEPVIATAESQASPDARIRFRYDWLRQDLERVRAGVQEHIDTPRNEPRKVPPLRGDYRQ